MITLAASLVLQLVAAADPVPDDEDVVAGWGAFALFGLLILAVAVLGVSLTRRLKNVDRAEELGLYDPSTRKSRAERENWPTVEPATPRPTPRDRSTDRTSDRTGRTDDDTQEK